METPEPNQILDKIEVASRQLDVAIWLWFNHSDIVSINQLVGSAFGVLDALFQKRKWPRPAPFGEPPEGMDGRTARELIKMAENFAKHARNEEEMLYEYNPPFTEVYMGAAVMAYTKLTSTEGEGLHGLKSLFAMWYGIHWPQHLDFPTGQSFPIPDERLKPEVLKKLSRTEFFQKLGGEFRRNPPRPE